jgi:putative heme transporter
VASRAGLLIAVAVLVFGVILPRVVDVDQVRTTLATLTSTQLVALAAATALAYIANAGPARLLVPGLSWPHAIGSDLAGRGVASVIPGPTDVATRYVLYRQWEIPADAATSGIVVAAMFETLSALALPAIAAIGLLVAGNDLRASAVWLSIGCVAVLLVAFAVLGAVVRSASIARRIGELLQKIADRLWQVVHRTPPTGIVDSVLDVRARIGEALSRTGALAYVAAVGAKLAWFVVLEVALWSVGITPQELPPSAVLTAMAGVALISLIPITPGAIGVSEVAYVGLLSAVAGQDLADEITAAVVIFRAAQWLLPIPIGWILLIVMRGSHWREFVTQEEPAPA